MTIDEMIERNDRLAAQDRWLIPMIFAISLGAGAVMFGSGMLFYLLVTSAFSSCPAPATITLPQR